MTCQLRCAQPIHLSQIFPYSEFSLKHFFYLMNIKFQRLPAGRGWGSGDSQGLSFIVAVTSIGLVVDSKPPYVLAKANIHFLLLFFPEEKLFEELKWRNWSLTYGWWVLTNDQRALRTLGFDFGKHAQFRCLFKTSKSHQSPKWFWQLQKSGQIAAGWGAIGVYSV